jgi:Holin of 3TMs, for gene-transfer release
MTPLLAVPLLELGGKIIDRLFPDPQKKAEAELELLKLTQDGSLKTVLAQLEVNAREAAHPSLFVAGWRPFVGWGCGAGMLYATVGHNLLGWLAVIMGWPVPPVVNADLLIYVLGGMLGIGGLRTVEKIKGATK